MTALWDLDGETERGWIESKREKNLELATNRLHWLNQYKVYFLLKKNFDKTIMDNKGIVIYVHLHKAAPFSSATLLY